MTRKTSEITVLFLDAEGVNHADQVHVVDSFVGKIEQLSAESISGWIARRSGSPKVVTLQLIINGVVRDVVRAALFRSDLVKPGLGDGNGAHAFQFDLSRHRKHLYRIANEVSIRTISPPVEILDRKIIIPFDLTRDYDVSSSLDDKSVDIFTITFFDLKGESYFSGGAERYLVDLIDLLRRDRFNVRIVQCSSVGSWRRHFRGIEVIGVPWDQTSLISASRTFGIHHRKGAKAIFSPFILGSAFCPPESIGISHGIFWDLPGNGYHEGENETLIKSAVKHLDTLISVDATTLNFIRGVAPAQLAAKSSKVIINYVDPAQFARSSGAFAGGSGEVLAKVAQLKQEKGATVFLYPRRLYAARGLDILIDAAQKILPAHSNAVILFVGRGFSADEQKVRDLAIQFPDQVFLTWLEAEFMVDAFDISDIVLIPTLHSEGTSLSCVEALYCGKCVVTTHVGGLCELVIDGFNGLVIEPTSPSLLSAMLRVLKQPELCRELANNGRSTGAALTKARWERQWCEVIERAWPQTGNFAGSDDKTGCVGSSFTVLHPAVPGIELGEMEQRPQALMRSLAYGGINTCFVNGGNAAREVDLEPWAKLEVVTANAEIFAADAVIYCYYPYTILEYADLFSLRISNADDAKLFAALLLKFKAHIRKQPRIHARNIRFWYDYLDRSDIHPDLESRQLVDLALKYSDIVTYSALTLGEDMLTKRKATSIYLGNAVSTAWRFAALQGQFGAPIAEARAGLAHEIDNFEVLSQWKAAGFKIGVFWGALADWTDLSFLDSQDEMLRFVLIGPVASDQIMRRVLCSPNALHIKATSPERLSLVAAYCDFGLVPFHVSEMTHCVNPLKLWEYLSLGLPVLASPMRELRLQFERLDEAMRRRIVFVDNMRDVGARYQNWRAQTDQKLICYSRTFVGEMGGAVAALAKLSGGANVFSLSIADLRCNLDLGSLGDARVIELGMRGGAKYSLALELPSGRSCVVEPTWRFDIPAGLRAHSVQLSLLLDQDVAVGGGVQVELISTSNGAELVMARATSNAFGAVNLHCRDFGGEPSCIMLKVYLPVVEDTSRHARVYFLRFHQFSISLVPIGG